MAELSLSNILRLRLDLLCQLSSAMALHFEENTEPWYSLDAPVALWLLSTHVFLFARRSVSVVNVTHSLAFCFGNF